MTQPVKMADEYVNHDLWNLDTTSAEAQNSTCCLKMYLNQLHAGYVWARGREREHVAMMASLMRQDRCRARWSGFTPLTTEKTF